MIKHIQKLKSKTLICLYLFSNVALAQSEVSKYDPRLVFDPLINFQGSSVYRTASGKPGPMYWQNVADYDIICELNPDKKNVSGSVNIKYTNNSPESLNFIWLQLDQNKFKKDSRGTNTTPPNVGRYGLKDFDGGYKLDKIKVVSAGSANNLKASFIDDTRMQLILNEPLKAGASVNISMDFKFDIPSNGADRMGEFKSEKGLVYEIAQWYPRVCVFDDIKGWNVNPYLGAGEFYLEYGNIKYQVSVPENYIVLGSGKFTNPQDVFVDNILKKYQELSKSNKQITLIEAKEFEKFNKKSKGSTVWKFECENTRDVAFAVAKNYVWDAQMTTLTSGKKVQCQSIYPQEESNNFSWGRSTEFVKHSIDFYSKTYYEFPYAAATNVAGIVSGMEYPGIVFCSAESRGPELFGVTDHEFGHTWFPMIVGSNERKYAWMDEGFNTYINNLSAVAFNKGEFYTTQNIGNMAPYFKNTKSVNTIPDASGEMELGLLAYFKPAVGLKMLSRNIATEERVNFALREYINRWAFKHPTPFDFFKTMNETLGEDLDWFWKSWYLESYNIDQAISKVDYINNKPESGAKITITNLEKMPMPIELEITEKGKDAVIIKLPVEIWLKSGEWTFDYPSKSEIKSIILDPNNTLPDINRKNNTWLPIK